VQVTADFYQLVLHLFELLVEQQFPSCRFVISLVLSFMHRVSFCDCQTRECQTRECQTEATERASRPYLSHRRLPNGTLARQLLPADAAADRRKPPGSDDHEEKFRDAD